MLELERVPKLLKNLTSEWAVEAFIVSFKLETDPDLVVPKAKQAIASYGVDLVVANQLQTRRDVVYLVDKVQESAFTLRRYVTLMVLLFSLSSAVRFDHFSIFQTRWSRKYR